jgi:hypothetical protein
VRMTDMERPASAQGMLEDRGADEEGFVPIITG